MFEQLFNLIISVSFFIGVLILLIQFSEYADKPFEKFLLPSIKFLLFAFLTPLTAKVLQQAWSKPETRDLLIGGTIAVAVAWLLHKAISGMMDHMAWEASGFVRSVAPINVTALGQTGNILKKVFPDHIRTEKDLRISAYHEAGHALLYALFPEERLSSLTASIKLGSGGWSTAGAVWAGIEKESAHTSESYLFARMMISLAGAEAEAIALGTRHDGCREDMQKYMLQAKTYLACGFMNSAYFEDPGDDAEKYVNAEAINNMLRHQKQLLEQFFVINRGVLDDLSDLLLKKQALGREELLPFLQSVIIPAEFPWRVVS